LPESAESKLNEAVNKRLTPRRAVFYPQVMGVVVLLIIVLAFTVGAARQEMALALAGAALLLPWVYCLTMTLFLALLHRSRARRAFIRVSPRDVTVGELFEAVYCESDTAVPTGKAHGAILQLPGILVRCRLDIAAKDGRRIRHDFNPSGPPHCFPAHYRGAYFSGAGHSDEFAVFDILGFFRFAYRMTADRIIAENHVRLLVSPHPADEAQTIHARSGDSNLLPEFSFQRTDNLVDHRPYVPGDDPRRINWKLYGHSSELLVREGEREPPPHSNITIVVDTGYDPRLYKAPEARRGIDVLCEHALACALACAESGMDVAIEYMNREQGIKNREQGAGNRWLSAALAWPAAMPLSAADTFPAVPADRGILILALPRTGAEAFALDRLVKDVSSRLAGKNTARSIDLIFICGGANRMAAAEANAAAYNRRPGVKAKVVASNE
jgi:hypothetical protein